MSLPNFEMENNVRVRNFLSDPLSKSRRLKVGQALVPVHLWPGRISTH